jgi:transposase-like protein
MPRARANRRSESERRRWTEVQARAVMDKLEASGEPVSVFAQREGLDAQRLYRWRRRLQARGDREAPPPTFLEIRSRSADALVEVVLRSARVLRVAESIDDGVLLRLVALLEREPC